MRGRKKKKAKKPKPTIDEQLVSHGARRAAGLPGEPGRRALQRGIAFFSKPVPRSILLSVVIPIIVATFVQAFISPKVNPFPRDVVRSEVTQVVGRAIKDATEHLTATIEQPLRATLKSHEELKSEIGKANPAVVAEVTTALQKGLERFAGGQYEEAAEQFRRAVALIPSYSGYFNLALSYESLSSDILAMESYQKALALREGDPHLYSRLGWVYLRVGKVQQAVLAHEKGLTVARRSQAGRLEAALLLDLGLVHYATGKLSESNEYLRKATEAYRSANDVRGEAIAIYKRGLVLAEQGNMSQGIDTLKVAINILGRLGEEEQAAKARNNLATVLLRSGQLEEAKALLSQNEATFETTRNRLELAGTWNNIGTLHLRQGQIPEAKSYYGKALVEFRAAKDRLGEGQALNNLAIVSYLQGDLVQAVNQMETAYELHTAGVSNERRVVKLANLGMLYAEKGDRKKAEERLSEARRLAEEVDNPYIVGKVLLTSVFARLPASAAEAIEVLSKAEKLFDSVGAKEEATTASQMVKAIREAVVRNRYIRIASFLAISGGLGLSLWLWRGRLIPARAKK